MDELGELEFYHYAAALFWERVGCLIRRCVWRACMHPSGSIPCMHAFVSAWVGDLP